jgi:hypothetical protein
MDKNDEKSKKGVPEAPVCTDEVENEKVYFSYFSL